jgi:hypothetical protein
MQHHPRAGQGPGRAPAGRARPRSSLALAPFALCSLFGLILAAPDAAAMPQAPALVCETYPLSAACTGQQPACTLCHTAPPVRNAFGMDLEAELAPDEDRPLAAEIFAAALPGALAAVEGGDSDGDGFVNRDELLAGSKPADADSKPSDGEPGTCEAPAGAVYDVCDRDAAYTFAKVMRDVCGRSPRIDEVDALFTMADPWQHIHATLDVCLGSEYWRGRDGVLWNLANRKIQPSASIKAGANAGAIPLGDYEDDYNLFVYTQTGDRDARELLTAQYMVSRTDGTPTVYQAYTRSPQQDVAERGLSAAQLVVPERRAGLLTSRWFLVTNVMFTALPRTAAAQAYRAYLGMDIARLEGLVPVSDEPVDYDAKTVTRAECAVCHSTLDPLTYPFTRYEGLGTRGSGAFPASYNPERLDRFADELMPDVAATPEAGAVLGQPVADLIEWARVAAESDEFARATVLDYWKLLVGDAPRPAEQDAFDALWQAFRGEHAYRVERMLHQLIDMEAYSVP